MPEPESILKFWLDDVGPRRWYAQDSALDATIRERFQGAWESTLQGVSDFVDSNSDHVCMLRGAFA